MSRTLWDVVVEFARGVDAGHAIRHGAPVQEGARSLAPGDGDGEASPPSA